jgi:hypothetical protein
MYPISRLRIETHFVMIRTKELPVGFRVVSAEAISIESLPEEGMKPLRDMLLSLRTEEPEKVSTVGIFHVEAINAMKSSAIRIDYVFGDYSDLASIQLVAATENGHQAELIKILNKEE